LVIIVVVIELALRSNVCIRTWPHHSPASANPSSEVACRVVPPSQPLTGPDRITVAQGGVILVGMLSASRRTEQSQASGDGRKVAAFAAGLPRLGSNLRLPRESEVAAKFNPESKWPGRRTRWILVVVVVVVVVEIAEMNRYIRTDCLRRATDLPGDILVGGQPRRRLNASRPPVLYSRGGTNDPQDWVVNAS